MSLVMYKGGTTETSVIFGSSMKDKEFDFSWINVFCSLF